MEEEEEEEEEEEYAEGASAQPWGTQLLRFVVFLSQMFPETTQSRVLPTGLNSSSFA